MLFLAFFVFWLLNIQRSLFVVFFGVMYTEYVLHRKHFTLEPSL